MSRFKKDNRGIPILPGDYNQLPAVEKREMMSDYVKETNEAVHGKIISGTIHHLIINQMALDAPYDYRWHKSRKHKGLYVPEDDSIDSPESAGFM